MNDICIGKLTDLHLICHANEFANRSQLDVNDFNSAKEWAKKKKSAQMTRRRTDLCISPHHNMCICGSAIVIFYECCSNGRHSNHINQIHHERCKYKYFYSIFVFVAFIVHSCAPHFFSLSPPSRLPNKRRWRQLMPWFLCLFSRFFVGFHNSLVSRDTCFNMQ